jgi:hypothetical protein
METHDFRALVRAARTLRKPAFRLVQKWQSSPQARMPFSVWLGSKHPQVKEERSGAWLEAAKGRLLKSSTDASEISEHRGNKNSCRSTRLNSFRTTSWLM